MPPIEWVYDDEDDNYDPDPDILNLIDPVVKQGTNLYAAKVYSLVN